MNSPKFFLDNLVTQYSKKQYLKSDPIEFCYRYESMKDIEIIGFISALFSYGNVLSIRKHLEILFNLFGNAPYAFIRKGNFSKIKSYIPKYRFQTSTDIFYFLKTLSIILKENESLENIFSVDNNSHMPLNERIVIFQIYFIKKTKEVSKKKNLSYGLSFLIGSGKITASHKRYCMFLRWMVRDSFPDFGIYKSINKKDLLYPTDVHIIRLSKILGFSNRNSVDFKMAKSISDNFKEINPKDPLAYDFPLSRLGILKLCKVKYSKEICEPCSLKQICKIYNSDLV